MSDPLSAMWQSIKAKDEVLRPADNVKKYSASTVAPPPNAVPVPARRMEPADSDPLGPRAPAENVQPLHRVPKAVVQPAAYTSIPTEKENAPAPEPAPRAAPVENSTPSLSSHVAEKYAAELDELRQGSRGGNKERSKEGEEQYEAIKATLGPTRADLYLDAAGPKERPPNRPPARSPQIVKFRSSQDTSFVPVTQTVSQKDWPGSARGNDYLAKHSWKSKMADAQQRAAAGKMSRSEFTPVLTPDYGHENEVGINAAVDKVMRDNEREKWLSPQVTKGEAITTTSSADAGRRLGLLDYAADQLRYGEPVREKGDKDSMLRRVQDELDTLKMKLDIRTKEEKVRRTNQRRINQEMNSIIAGARGDEEAKLEQQIKDVEAAIVEEKIAEAAEEVRSAEDPRVEERKERELLGALTMSGRMSPDSRPAKASMRGDLTEEGFLEADSLRSKAPTAAAIAESAGLKSRLSTSSLGGVALGNVPQVAPAASILASQEKPGVKSSVYPLPDGMRESLPLSQDTLEKYGKYLQPVHSKRNIGPVDIDPLPVVARPSMIDERPAKPSVAETRLLQAEEETKKNTQILKEEVQREKAVLEDLQLLKAERELDKAKREMEGPSHERASFPVAGLENIVSNRETLRTEMNELNKTRPNATVGHLYANLRSIEHQELQIQQRIEDHKKQPILTFTNDDDIRAKLKQATKYKQALVDHLANVKAAMEKKNLPLVSNLEMNVLEIFEVMDQMEKKLKNIREDMKTDFATQQFEERELMNEKDDIVAAHIRVLTETCRVLTMENEHLRTESSLRKSVEESYEASESAWKQRSEQLKLERDAALVRVSHLQSEITAMEETRESTIARIEDKYKKMLTEERDRLEASQSVAERTMTSAQSAAHEKIVTLENELQALKETAVEILGENETLRKENIILTKEAERWRSVEESEDMTSIQNASRDILVDQVKRLRSDLEGREDEIESLQDQLSQAKVALAAIDRRKRDKVDLSQFL